MTNSSDITLDELLTLTNSNPRSGLGYIRLSSLREIRKMDGEITTQTQRDHISAFAQREGIQIVGWTSGELDEQAVNRALVNLVSGAYVGKGKTASSPENLDLVGTWEERAAR